MPLCHFLWVVRSDAIWICEITLFTLNSNSGPGKTSASLALEFNYSDINLLWAFLQPSCEVVTSPSLAVEKKSLGSLRQRDCHLTSIGVGCVEQIRSTFRRLGLLTLTLTKCRHSAHYSRVVATKKRISFHKPGNCLVDPEQLTGQPIWVLIWSRFSPSWWASARTRRNQFQIVRPVRELFRACLFVLKS